VPVLETAEVTSGDGTVIRYRTLGDGPPLIIVHGTLTTSDDYVPVAVRLASTHQVVLVDRRGYRSSEIGPAPATIGQDAADLRQLIGIVGSPCAVFAHSAGALAALVAAREDPTAISALVLYEPPLLFTGPARQPLLDRFRELRDAGDDSGALVAFTSAMSAVPEEVIALWIGGPTLTPRLAGLAAGVGRDLEAMVGFDPSVTPWIDLAVPLTLIVGGQSPEDPLAASVRELGEVLPGTRTVVLAGQEAVAHVLAPDLLAEVIRGAIDR
jgi:pimeloyl-ACP methyl ester carboxylesterase